MSADATNHAADRALWRRLPVLQGLLPFDPSQIGPDVLAGITLAALGIPEVMGYTKIIGTPVITGLYTLFLPVLAFALFGSSRHLVVSADSATAAMVAASLTALSFTAYSPRYVELTSVIALVTAAILMLARILRLGFLADFLSRTVLVGFLTGVGVQVAGGELSDMLRIKPEAHGFLGQLFYTLAHVRETHVLSLLIALGALAIIVGCEAVAPKIPGGLLAVVGLTTASAVFHWSGRGVQVIGEVPNGLPHIGLPHLAMSDVKLVIPISLSCFIVILAQSAATSRAYALRYRDTFNQNEDLVGLSLANALAGCSSTFVVNGSPTKTAIVDTAGGRSQWSHVATAAVVLIVLLFLTHPLSFLPSAVLAAIVFLIGVKLIDYRGMAAIWRAARGEFLLALITAATVVVFGVEQGIVLAMVLSLLMHVRHSYRPHVGVVVRDEKDHWRIEDPAPAKQAEPGMVMFWFGAGLFYANATFFAEQARRLIEPAIAPVRWLVIDARSMTDIDYSAGRALVELQQDLAKQGIALAMIVVEMRHKDSLLRMGLVDLIGDDRIFESRHECVQAYQAEGAKPA